MMTLIGTIAGSLFCLYSVAFRWRLITAKYGRLDLYFWVIAVLLGGSFIGYFLDVAIWVVWSAARGQPS